MKEYSFKPDIIKSSVSPSPNKIDSNTETNDPKSLIDRLYHPKFTQNIKERTQDDVEVERNYAELTFHP